MRAWKELVFVYTVDESPLTLPHRAGALQYRCRPHDVLCIMSTRRCLRPLVLTASLSSANPRSTDHILSIYALHVDDHLCAGSSLCLPPRVGEYTSRRLDNNSEKCCVSCTLLESLNTSRFCRLSLFYLLPLPCHYTSEGQNQNAC